MKTPMAGNVKFIEHAGKRILMIDFSRCELDEIVTIVHEGKKLIATEAKNSVLTLTDVTNTRNNAAVVRVLKEYTTYNRPFVKAGAVVGLDGLKKVVFEAIMKFSRREFFVAQSIERAKEWLVKQ